MKTEFAMSTSTGIRVRVRTSGGEIEIEVGDPSSVDAAMDAVSRIVRELAAEEVSTGAGEGISAQPRDIDIQRTTSRPPGDLPEVRVERGDSLADVIKKMFGGEWGRRPRKLSDVMDALASYGFIYPKSSVAVALLRLAKDGEIRRFKQEGEYVYIQREPSAGGGS